MNQEINDVYSQLAVVVNNTYAKLANKVLFKSKHGIVVYNKYVIKKTKSGYNVIARYGSEIKMFNSARNALVWIILDNFGKCPESKRVAELDIMIASVDLDNKNQQRLSSGGNMESYLIHTCKLQRNKEKQRQFIYELDKYIILAQKCQQQGIYNETK